MNDFRLALRTLLRNPGFTTAAVLCLALAIGANTAIFSVVDAVLLRDLPFADPDRLVMAAERGAQRPEHLNVVSPANFLDWQKESRTLESSAAFVEFPVTLTGLGDPELLPVQFVSGAFFDVLGVRAERGRTFGTEEDQPNASPVVVLSHGFWQRRLGGDPAAIGRSLMINDEAAMVVGVMPAGFSVPGSTAELWMPLGLDPANDYRISSGRYLRVIGRLAPAATIAGSDTELRTIARRLEQAHEFNAGWSATVVPLREQIIGGSRRPLLVISGVVAFVLLIACANVANLSLARAARRHREIAVRTALGASGWRVVRAQLTESVLVAVIGGGLGLLLAVWGTQALVALAPAGLPRAGEIGVNGRTLAFTTLLSILTGVLFGIAPALQSVRADLHGTMKEGSRGNTGSRTRGVLVAVQVALSLMLLVGAGLMIRSFTLLSRVEPGLDPERVLTARIDLPDQRYDTPEKQLALFEGLLERVRALPGVRSASVTSWLPFDGVGSSTGFYVGGRELPAPGKEPGADVLGVDPQYFKTLEIPVERGALFTEQERAGTPRAVVINRALADANFKGEDPIGRMIHMPWGDTLVARVVAVVANVRGAGLDSLPHPTLYWPLAQFPWSSVSLVARTTGEPMEYVAPVAGALHALDPALPLARPRPLESYLGNLASTRRFTMFLLGAFAAVAVILAAIGIAGVIGNNVAQRTREIGVRVALGAQPRDVLQMVLRQGVTLAGAGIIAGLIGAAALTRVLGTLLYGTSPTHFATYAAVALLLAAIALAATWVPARRATRVDPLTALRAE